MLLYRWNDNNLQIKDDRNTLSIELPEGFTFTPVISKDRSYIAIGGNKKVCVYDTCNDRIIECKHKFKYNVINDMRFDMNNQLYLVDGNSIVKWNITNNSVETLYEMKRAVHGPSNIGVSPDGKYVSFCKYRSSSDYMFLLDTQTGECRDLKFSVYRYMWIDNTRIAWTKSGGLKILDAETGKSKTIVKDHTTLLKKSSREDAGLLDYFAQKPDSYYFINLDLLGMCDERLWFSFAIRHFVHNNDGMNREMKEVKHLGVWNVNTDGSKPKFCYDIPSEYYKAIGYRYFDRNGNIGWLNHEGMNIWNGELIGTIACEWGERLCLKIKTNKNVYSVPKIFRQF